MSGDPPVFDAAFRERLSDLFLWRRDVRRFLPTPIAAETVARLIGTADLAPSVGLSQPWRFVSVESAGGRAAVRAAFAAANADALAAQGDDRAAAYARLKLAGLDEAPVQIAVYVEPDPEQGHGLGRRTMPETVAFSAVLAIHTLWLAARAEGLGLGWVSILDPETVTAALDLPEAWRLVAYLCLGHPADDSETPELERAGWEHRRDEMTLVIR